MAKRQALYEEVGLLESAALMEKTNAWLGQLSGLLAIDTPSMGPDATRQEIVQCEQMLMEEIVKAHREIQSLEADRFSQKANLDKTLFEDSLGQLGTITQKKNKGHGPINDSHGALFQVCCLIGMAMKIDLGLEFITKEQMDFLKELPEISQALGMPYRQVALRGKWWQKDNGPLLAYMEADHRPVALIPLSPGKYQLKDPQTNDSVIVSQKTAQAIKPFAYTFYRPFPSKKIGFWEMVLELFKPLWKMDLVIVFAMGIMGGILAMIFPFATGIIFDEIIPEAQGPQLIYVGMFLIIAAISKLLFEFVQHFAMQRIEVQIDEQMQASIWDRVLSLPVGFFKDYSVGDLAMKIMNLGAIRQTLSEVVLSSVFSVIFSIPSILLLFYYDKRLAMQAMSLTLLAMVISFVFAQLKASYNKKEIDLGNKLSGLVFELIGGIKKFRASGSERRAFALWAKEFSRLRRITYRSQLLSNGFLVFYDIFPLLVSMIIFIWVTRPGSDITLGRFIAFNAAFTSVLISVLALTDGLMVMSQIVPVFKSASPILESLPEYKEINQCPGRLKGEIEINQVSFKYAADSPLVLKDISFHIKPGEFVAIVGESGSGKSTLLRILLGFEKPMIGKVYYDGQDLEEIDIRKVRKQLGVVLQNSRLMAGDIYSNIVGSHPHLTLEDAWEAARKAGIEEDIRNMPMGMQTILAEEGGGLSGGQSQRLSIASAIASKPRILYFDEATSALDNQTQRLVGESLEQLKVTRLVIAHRLSTIINCDRIIVLSQGEIVEQGSYQELLKQGGVFKEMVKRQIA